MTKKEPVGKPPAGKSTESKVGAGPALAAHPKDAATTGKSGQNVKATTKRS